MTSIFNVSWLVGPITAATILWTFATSNNWLDWVHSLHYQGFPSLIQICTIWYVLHLCL